MKQFFVAIWLLGCGPPGPEPEPPKEPLIDAPEGPIVRTAVPAAPSSSSGHERPTQTRTTVHPRSGDIARKSATLALDAVSFCPSSDERCAAIPTKWPVDR